MKKMTLIIIALFSILFAASKATKPYTFTSGTAARSSEVNKNFDTIYAVFNRAVDTINKRMPHWEHFDNHDSTFRYMNIDSIKGPVVIDSINGSVVYTGYLKGAGIRRSTSASWTLLSGDTANNGPSIEFYGKDHASAGGFAYANFGGKDTIGSFVFRRVKTNASTVNIFKIDSNKVISYFPVFSTGLLTNNEDTLVYNDTTFYDSLYDGASYVYRVVARIVRIGRQITLYQPNLVGPITAATTTHIHGIPIKFLPQSGYNTRLVGWVNENSTDVIGQYRITGTVINIYNHSGDYLAAGTGGTSLDPLTLIWILDN